MKEIKISVEKLRLISAYFEFPFGVFFMPENILREEVEKNKTRSNYIRKQLEKLEKIKEILEEE